jgi:NTE family protein
MTATARSTAPRPVSPTLTVVYGGGGLFGIAYALGVVDACETAGLPLRTATALGTSAGAWVAACVATGVGIDVMRELPAPRVPDLRPGLLHALARDVFGDASSALVRIAVTRLSTCTREIFSSASFPLADLVAASSAVPGLFAPWRLCGSRFVDGGLRSLTSADQAPVAEHLIVVAPLAGPALGPAGWVLDRLLAGEVNRWRRATGGVTHLLCPDRALRHLIRHPGDLFDKGRADTAYRLTRERTALLLRSRADFTTLLRPLSVASDLAA